MASTKRFKDDIDIPFMDRVPIGGNLLEGILKTSVAAILLVDLDGQIIFANDAAETVLGVETSLIMQRSYNAPEWQVTDLEGNPLPALEWPFNQVMEQKKAVFDMQISIRWPGGERRYLSVNGAPLKDGSGTIAQIIFSMVDITALMQSQKAQQDALDFYRQTFESSPAIKLLIDPTTADIVDANPAAATFYGYPIETLRQMKITDINTLPPKTVQARMEQTRTLNSHCWHFPHRLASGEIRQVEVHSSRFQLQGRELLYSIIHDITDRQCFEDALQSQLQQEKLLEGVTQAIRQSLDLNVVLQTTVNQVRRLLNADRVIIYRPSATGMSGAVVVESCAPAYPPLLGWKIGDTSLEQKRFIQPYGQGQSQAIANISTSDLDPAYVQLLETFDVKSQLTIPILYTSPSVLVHSSANSTDPLAGPMSPPVPPVDTAPLNQIWGLLIIHQCSTEHPWHDWELALLQRLEMQLAVAIQQAELYQQVQQLNLDLEEQVRQRTSQLQKSLSSEAVLKRITDKIHDNLNESAILQTAVRELGLALNLIRCHASLYDLDQQTATVCYEYSASVLSSKGSVTEMGRFPEIYQPLLAGQPLQFCTPGVPTQVQSSMLVLCYPIGDDDQGVLGDLKLLSPRDYGFDQRDLQLVQQVAKQCAIAIRQSRLYQAAQTQIRELEKLNRLKDDFLSTTSHELRTPLSSIKMSTQLMEALLRQGGEPIPPKLERCLGILRDECDREITLINDLLLLQQLNAETQPFIPSTFKLQDWLPQVVQTFEETFQAHQQTCRLDLSSTLPSITTDLFMFNRVLGELLTNAYKFTPAGETITITAEFVESSPITPQPHLQLCLTNTGVAIAPHELPHIFEQFYRIPSHDPWKYGGTGLGLALVKRLTQYLGGSIRATSPPGQTCFTLTLPLQGRPA